MNQITLLQDELAWIKRELVRTETVWYINELRRKEANLKNNIADLKIKQYRDNL